MKILLVAIPNHHFFQWANQLKDSGFEVFWFDITDGAGFVEKISWVTQYNGWKLKLDYPFRYKIKKSLPKLHKILEKITTNKTELVFEKLVSQIRPDIIHCFEMQLAGLPILPIMQKNTIPFMYSSWGSDIYFFEHYKIKKSLVLEFLNRLDYVISDCKRDSNLIKQLGFKKNEVLVFPGNGGLTCIESDILDIQDRKTIVFKGYQMDVGEAIQILKALEILPILMLESYHLIVYSADYEIIIYIKNSKILQKLNWTIHKRTELISNSELLNIFGKSILHLGNNISDGMPNSLLEAMGMGAFPIQSNPGKVTEEVIKNGVNGFLIENPNDSAEIASHIQNALLDLELLENAKTFNTYFIDANYNRTILRDKIVFLYSTILKIQIN